ncbi:hypothetical protein N9B53_03855, partial [Mariniblastus sp.]|nr:hypothetical protein [Mariniblastus sp.]
MLKQVDRRQILNQKLPPTTQNLKEPLMIRIRSANSEKTFNSRFFHLDWISGNPLDCLFQISFRKFSPRTLMIVAAFWF